MSTMLIKTINLVCLLAIQSEGIQLNLALRKRAHLSSVSNERHAIYAVDGNVFKTFAQAANEEDSGWFVVDLGRPYMVESILYYIPYCHNCDNNFIIGLSNNFDPQINKTLNSDYKLCGQYNGSLAPDGGVQLQCKDKKAYSRHVIVRQIGKPFLTISELAVLGKYINYIGCFTSLLINETIGLNLSLENCINKCENLNYVYAGIQVTRCVCGNETKNYSPLSECNVLCPGDVDYCGSSNKMSVYEVFPLKFLKNIQRRYIGCSNASPGHFIKYDEDMAVEKCQNHCAKNNFLFFRIQNGSECGCGNLYSKLDVEESSCNITCSGNPFEKCGGPDRKSLYSIYSENGGSSYFKTNHHCKNRSELDLDGICGSKQCEDGWTGEDCAVRDCSVNNGDCGEHVCQTLQGTTGVFSECICSEGFDKNFWWDYCHDINECEDETVTCDTRTSTCVNKNGNYECKCFSGFQQNILDECQDIDECVTENRCNVQTTHCHNTFGSYFCTCREGFIYDSPQNCIESLDLRSLLNINKKLEMKEHEEMESGTGADWMTNVNDDVANDKKYYKEIWKLMRESTEPYILNDDESDIDYDDRFSEELSKLSKNPREEVIWEEPTVKSPDCWQVAMYGGTIASYSPSCNVYGGYTAKQCYLERCWCVNKIGQPMKKIYDENGEVSWKFLEWRDGVDSGIDDSYFTYGYKAIKLDCESLFAEYKLYYLANLEKKIREILSSTGNPSETIVHDLPATNYQKHLESLHKELTSPSSITGTQTKKARSSASHNSATTTAAQVGDNAKFEVKTEVQAPNLKLQNFSVHDEETFSQQDHDQKPNEKTLAGDIITTVANVAINGSHLKENLTSDRTEIYVESKTPGNKFNNNSQSFSTEISTNLTNPSNGIS